MITAWNDAEDGALQGLTCDAQVLYLRGLRRYMDYRTGVAGIARRIDEACLRETLEFHPDRGSSMRRRTDLTRQFIRSRLDELRRVGLIADVASDPGRRGYIFRLVLADTDQSAQNMNNRRTTTKSGDEQPHEQPLEQPHKNASNQRGTRIGQPDEQPNEQQFHSETIGLGTTTHPVSGKELKISTANAVLVAAKADDEPERLRCPTQQILSAYHELLPELPPMRSFPEQSAKMLRARIREDRARLSADWWRNFFRYVRRCPHLMGSSQSGWQADLMWLVRPTNFAKVVNGNYDANKQRFAA